MGIARNLLRAALDLPIEKPAAQRQRSLGIRILRGSLLAVSTGLAASIKEPMYPHFDPRSPEYKGDGETDANW